MYLLIAGSVVLAIPFGFLPVLTSGYCKRRWLRWTCVLVVGWVPAIAGVVAASIFYEGTHGFLPTLATVARTCAVAYLLSVLISSFLGPYRITAEQPPADVLRARRKCWIWIPLAAVALFGTAFFIQNHRVKSEFESAMTQVIDEGRAMWPKPVAEKDNGVPLLTEAHALAPVQGA